MLLIMKKLPILFLLASATVASAQTTPPRLIVRGDDMGYSHAGNEAIVKTYTEGIASSIELIGYRDLLR